MASLEMLLGSWIDGQGSRYDVELDACGRRCTVATTRPSGFRRVTRGLVRLEASGCIHWAGSFKLDADPAAPESVVWANSRGGKTFEWFRQDTEDRKVKRKEKTRWEEKKKERKDMMAATEDDSHRTVETPRVVGSRQKWKKKEAEDDSCWKPKPDAVEDRTWKRHEQKQKDKTQRMPERESAPNKQNWSCNQCGATEDLQRDPGDPDNCYCASCWDDWEVLEEEDPEETSSDRGNEELEDVLRDLKGKKLKRRVQAENFAERLLACFPREAHLELDDKGVCNLVHFRAHECKSWLQGCCSAGNACTFAHGKHEICSGSVADRLCAAARAMQALASSASTHRKDGEPDNCQAQQVVPVAESDFQVQKANARQPPQMEDSNAVESDAQQLQNKSRVSAEATSRAQPKLEAAREIVAEGDRLSCSGNWQRAMHRYTAGLEWLSSSIMSDSPGEPRLVEILRSKIHANMSRCYLKMEQFQDAEAEASRCLELTPTNGKVLVWRSAAREKLGDLDKAFDDLEQAQAIDPAVKNRAATAKERILQAWQQQLESRREDIAQLGREPGKLSNGKPNPAGWADGLDAGSQQDWFINCYRMRVHEDYTSGGHFHGLYDPDAGAGGIAFDFLLFCKLAVARRAVPLNWEWPACLKKASKTLMYTFEKGDAKGSCQAYRRIAELIYGTSSLDSDGPSKMEDAIELELARRIGRRPSSRNLHGRVLDDVGGEQSWSKFREKLGDDETDEDDDESWFGKDADEEGDEEIDSDCREEFWLCQQNGGI